MGLGWGPVVRVGSAWVTSGAEERKKPKGKVSIAVAKATAWLGAGFGFGFRVRVRVGVGVGVGVRAHYGCTEAPRESASGRRRR